MLQRHQRLLIVAGCCSGPVQVHNACWHSCAVSEEEAEVFGECALNALGFKELGWTCTAELKAWTDPALWGTGESGTTYGGNGYIELSADYFDEDTDFSECPPSHSLCRPFSNLDDAYPTPSEFLNDHVRQCGFQMPQCNPVEQISGTFTSVNLLRGVLANVSRMLLRLCAGTRLLSSFLRGK